MFVRVRHGLGGHAHVLEDFGVGVGVLEGFPLELDGRQSTVDPIQLLFIALFPLQGLKSHCTMGKRRKYGGFFFFMPQSFIKNAGT